MSAHSPREPEVRRLSLRDIPWVAVSSIVVFFVIDLFPLFGAVLTLGLWISAATASPSHRERRRRLRLLAVGALIAVIVFAVLVVIAQLRSAPASMSSTGPSEPWQPGPERGSEAGFSMLTAAFAVWGSPERRPS